MNSPDEPVAVPARQEAPELLNSAFLQGASKARKLLEDGLGFVVFATLALMTVTVFAGVISRYVFNSALSWSEEFAIWGFTWLIFLGAALGVARDSHIGVELVPVPKKPVSRLVFMSLRIGLTAFALIMLTTGGYDLARTVGGLSASLQWPNAIRYSIVPVAAVIGLVFLLTRDIRVPGKLAENVGGLVVGIALYALFSLGLGHVLDGFSPSVVITVSFFVCLALGVPVAFCLLIGVFLTTFTGGLLPSPAVVQNAVNGAGKFILLAIPFFLTAGYLLTLGGLSSRLIGFANSLVGHFRGGLAHVNVLNSFMIGGISGSPGADAASTTKIVVPEMVKRGYDPAFSCAITAVGAILPNVVPPAIAMLVFASVVDVSIAKLFMAGILPGVLVALALMITSYVIAVRRNYESASKAAGPAEIWRTFVKAIPVLFIVVVVLGGIRFGITTATEAGVMTLVYTVILGKFFYKAYTWKTFYVAFRDCGVETAIVAFLIAATAPFAWSLVAEQVPQLFIGWATTLIDTRIGILLLMNAILFIVGMFLDLTPAMLIVAPLFMPVLASVGVDPVQAGIIMIIVLQLGGVTPPVGILVFITAQVAKVEAMSIFRAVIPFIFAVLAVVVLLDLVPWFTTWKW